MHLTRTEFALLAELVRNPEAVLTHENLLATVSLLEIVPRRGLYPSCSRLTPRSEIHPLEVSLRFLDFIEPRLGLF